MKRTEIKPACHGQAKASGFTLMEVMLATLILGIVFSTIYGAWVTVSGTSRMVEDGIADFESAESCLSRILFDLQGVYLARRPEYAPPEVGGDFDPHRILGQPSGSGDAPFPVLRFTARSHLPLSAPSRGGTTRIAYYLDSNTGGPPFVIRRADDLFPYDELEPSLSDPVLCKNVRALAFTFTDQDGEIHDHWDSDAKAFGHATPTVVGIKMEIGDKENARVFRTATTLPVTRKRQG